MLQHGEVAEWSNVPDSKSGVPGTVPGVRIPPSPPAFASNEVCEGCRDEARRFPPITFDNDASYGSARPAMEYSSEVGLGSE